MGSYVFYAVCLGLWGAFAWALVSHPALLDRTWGGVRRLPLLAQPLLWIAFLPWLSGLAIWESGWRTEHARLAAVVVIALAFIAFWSVTTFGSAA